VIQAQPIYETRTVLGEGALWDVSRQVLYWIDIEGKKVFEYNPETEKNITFDMPQMVGTVVKISDNKLAAALQDGIYSLDLETHKISLMLAGVHTNPKIRFNDGKCDPAGRFWVGTMGMGIEKAGALYRIDADLSIHEMVRDVSVSNGIIWDEKKAVMYYVDSHTHTIDAFDFDLIKGEIHNRRVVVDVPQDHGVADGIWLDVNGNIWSAHFRGGCVYCWSPVTGKVVETIRVPGASLVTSCAFGGKNIDELYITTASLRQDWKNFADEKNAGFLFKAMPGVRGIPAVDWKILPQRRKDAKN
jgi:sugar lactone lactonase YvrE